MDKQRKSLSTKKPPIPSNEHEIIEQWMSARIMPGIKPLIAEIDQLIHEAIPDLHYAIKWGNAFYGTHELGWLIELTAYDVSVNIVFLNGAAFQPQPPLGTGQESRYFKLKTIDELNDQNVMAFIKQAAALPGWK